MGCVPSIGRTRLLGVSRANTTGSGVRSMPDIFTAYLITFGWAIVGSLSMGIGILLTLKIFAFSTQEVDEWSLVKQGNIPIAVILAAVIISLGLVVASAVRP